MWWSACASPTEREHPRPDAPPALVAEVAATMLQPAPGAGPDTVEGDAIVTDAADLAALAGVRAIAGDLVVEQTTLDAVELPLLEEVGGDVRVWENDALATLALPSLALVGGDLSLYDDPVLDSLAGLSRLRSVGGTLSLNRLEALVDLRGLEALETVGADLYVFHDVSLASLDGLASLRSVGGEIDLWETYALASATFPVLESVGGKLDLFEADALVSLSLPALAVLGAYELHECDAMTGVGEFPLVETLPGNVVVKWSDAVVSLAGFGALRSANGLVLDELPALPAIDLPALATLELLEVSHNDALADPGLPALGAIGTSATVVLNPLLSQCALDALFDRAPPLVVVCGANLDDGCAGWCVAGAP